MGQPLQRDISLHLSPRIPDAIMRLPPAQNAFCRSEHSSPSHNSGPPQRIAPHTSFFSPSGIVASLLLGADAFVKNRQGCTPEQVATTAQAQRFLSTVHTLPPAEEDHKQKGNEAFARHEIAKALQHYLVALRTCPFNVAVLCNLAACWLRNGDPAKALRVCSRAKCPLVIGLSSARHVFVVPLPSFPCHDSPLASSLCS